MSTTRNVYRAGVLAGAISVAGLLAATPAMAHVTAHTYGDTPEQEGYGAVTLRVPNEDPDHGTIGLELTIPEEYAIPSVRTKPVPGWSAEVITTELDEPVAGPHGSEVTEIVTGIVWEAEPGNEISAGMTEYQEFAFSAGPLPGDTSELVLPAAQVYEGGDVVDWDAPPPAEGEDEPSHPAPVVPLAEPGDDGHGHSHDAEGTDGADGDEHATGEEPATDSTARWLAGAGLALGALGAGAGVGAAVTARRSRQAADGQRHEDGNDATGGEQP
ncbi:YcnI family protein [Haloechinothrix sp. LS1_15]|uniref:YcnI family copper-binding membrane protein n=1 Tax=Haloechinothrix sp. LS1_15 TaxID=2652248 RepID=UPI00294711CE|nr:YcnI family protein [Haloechinothrix sp. LS1_15]MDV6010884.1 YcnI family protein [Haloechinothrix sp. LS1_15]